MLMWIAVKLRSPMIAPMHFTPRDVISVCSRPCPTGKVAVKGIGLPFASFGMYKFEPEFPGPLIPPSNFPTLTSIYLVNRLARFGFQLSRRCPFPEPENSLASNQRAGLTPCSLVTTNANYILNSKLSHATLITLPINHFYI